ncbi:MAG: hypothetical protein V1792_11215 [Pseudomonadota bacterium]
MVVDKKTNLGEFAIITKPLRQLSRPTRIEDVIEIWLRPKSTYRPKPGEQGPEGSVLWDLGDKLLYWVDKQSLKEHFAIKRMQAEVLASRPSAVEEASKEIEVDLITVEEGEIDEKICGRIFGKILAQNTRTVKARVKVVRVGKMEPSVMRGTDD